MPDKKQIVNSIATIAKRLGRAPTRTEFTSGSGISPFFVLQWFSSWSEAVKAAGFRPYTLNKRVEDRALLEDWGKSVRRNRGVLPRHMYLREGRYNPCTLAKRFGGWTALPQTFRKFAKGKRGWTDVLALLPARGAKKERGCPKHNAATSRGQAPLKDRPSYGNPMPFNRFRHEPVNEQGVVLLFGMLAKDLGFLIEAVQKGFPDCEAKRQVAPGQWQRVNIEFEFESRNFHDHGHSVNGCDVIVCWRHNWEKCPQHIEVVELSRVIRALALRD